MSFQMKSNCACGETLNLNSSNLFDEIDCQICCGTSEVTLIFEKGASKANGGFVKTQPREWTKSEIELAQKLKAEGKSTKQIAEILDRSEVSVSIKMKRLSKLADRYNSKHREMKYQANKAFFDSIQPQSVLDVFAGNSYWLNLQSKTLTNDKSDEFQTDFHMDALKLLAKLYAENAKFDLVDLDPFGSAYECFDLAVKMARKGVVVSFGEIGHKRWKRFDYVAPRYGINDLQNDWVAAFISEFQRIASLNKKIAHPVIVLEYDNFCRVYFELELNKITSQWEN